MFGGEGRSERNLTQWYPLSTPDKNRAFKDKRIEHAESTIINFSQYIESWKRLITIATLKIDRKLSKEEHDRMERYINARDDSKHLLIAQISTLPLFFDFRVISEFEKLPKWNKEQSTKIIERQFLIQHNTTYQRLTLVNAIFCNRASFTSYV